jgi:hypothetical protein
MGKHDSGYQRVARDFYPTPGWVIEALAEHVSLAGKRVLEPACGDGRMAEALKGAGAKVYATDIEDRGYRHLDRAQDFLLGERPSWPFNGIVTNPPFGKGGRLAEKFIARGLELMPARGFMALLLSIDFDSGITRSRFFASCPLFAGKIVLLGRIKWFEIPGKAESPKENSAWYLWEREPRLFSPSIMYAPRSRYRSAP